MLRKILILLLLVASYGSYAQSCAEDAKDVSCFDINILREDLSNYAADGEDQYLVCVDQLVTVIPSPRTDYLNKTDRYTVEGITYNPYPFREGAIVNVGIDARAAQDVLIPFEFNFFGENFDRVSIHSNGVVNLTDGTRFKGAVSDDIGPWAGQCGQNPNTGANIGCSGTDPLNPLPKGGPGNSGAGWLNSIAGVSHHFHAASPGPAVAGAPNSLITTTTYGEAPCRVFVINFANMPTYNLDAQWCLAITPNSQTSQILLYETTNVIEVHVERSNGCPLDARGRGTIGINGPTGTVAYWAPQRNAQHFDVVEEAWRFGPNGDPLWEVEWYENGVFKGKGITQDFTIDNEKNICARLAINSANGDFLTDSYSVTFRPDIDIRDLELEQQIVCDLNQNEFDLHSLNQLVINHQGGETAHLLKFFYYETQDDAENKLNRISNERSYPINMGENQVWMRIEGRLPDCFEIVPVKILKVPVQVKEPKHVNLCEKYTLPTLTDEEFYYKLERLDEDGNYVVETLPEPFEGQLIDKIGYYKVSIKKTNEYGCQDVKSFILFVENCSYPKGISPNGDGENDLLDLTYNNVVELKVFNRYGKVVYEHGKGYKRQWMGQDSNGNLLPSGTYFLYVKTKNYEYQDWIQLMQEIKQ